MNNKKKFLYLIIGLILFALVDCYLVIMSPMDEMILSKENSKMNMDLLSHFVYLVNSEEFHTEEEFTYDTLSTRTKYEMALKRVDPSSIKVKCSNDCTSITFSVSRESMEKGFRSAFGESVKIVEMDKLEMDAVIGPISEMNIESSIRNQFEEDFSFISKESFILEYDEETDSYSGTFLVKKDYIYKPKYPYSSILKVGIKDGKYVLVEKIVFVEEDGKYQTLYKDYRHTQKIGTVSISKSSRMDKYIDKGSVIIYEFEENEDGTYHFVKSTMKG